jgi:hypothetical protein
MVIDIRNDVPDFLAYVCQRVEQHMANSEPSDRISQIIFGFEIGQGNDVWLHFDTRPNPEPDGAWTRQIGKIPVLKRPKWPTWESLPEGEQVIFIDLQGQQVEVTTAENTDELICTIVGDALKHVLLTARDSGLFKSLPKSDRCEMGVMDVMSGYYGWPAYQDRGKENMA